jgi:hypothetical protein
MKEWHSHKTLAWKRPPRLLPTLRLQHSLLSTNTTTALTGLLPSSSAFGDARRLLSDSALGSRHGIFGPTALTEISGLVGVPAGCMHTRRRGPGEHGVYASMLDACEVVGPAVEVGVLHGAFSLGMLRRWHGLTHYTVCARDTRLAPSQPPSQPNRFEIYRDAPEKTPIWAPS